MHMEKSCFLETLLGLVLYRLLLVSDVLKVLQ